MPFLFRLAWRDLVASGRSLWVFIACLILGVSLVASSASLYRLIAQNLVDNARVLMGGDIELSVPEPLPTAVLDWIQGHGDTSLVMEVNSMLGTSAGQFQRVELLSVDQDYPLYGELKLQPSLPLAKLTALNAGHWGVVIDPVLAQKLALKVGDLVSIGALEMQVRALVMYQPDRALSANWRGMPVLLAADAVRAAELIQPGSRVDYNYRLRTDTPNQEWRTDFHAAFPDLPVRVRTFEDRQRRLSERLDQISSGLLIIAFCTLFVGGLGVFNSIQTHLHSKLKTMAILRSLGLRDGRLARLYLLQIGLLSGLASLLGALIGGGLALAAARLIAAEVALQTTANQLIMPLLVAWLFGVITAYSFTLPVLGRALAVQAAILMRGSESMPRALPRRWAFATAVCVTLLLVLITLLVPDIRFGAGFIVVVAVLLVLLEGVVRLIRTTARRIEQRASGQYSLVWRLALANLYRPGAPLRISLLSLGSALTLLVVSTLVVGALLRAIATTIPTEAPALVLYDVLPHQREAVKASVQAVTSLNRIELAPLVRARIGAINGAPLQQHLSEQTMASGAAQREHKLSYLANNMDSVNLIAGQWWQEPIQGIPRMAIEDREANQLGLGLGDEITFIVAGDTLELQIAAIYSQKGLQTRFWFEGIVSQGALDGATERYVGAVFMSDADALQVQSTLAATAPNVITVRTAMLLATARQMLDKASSALTVVALISLTASFLVLASVMAAGRTHQVYEATLLHVLGARLGMIKRSLLVEYLLLAVLASLFAVLLGSVIAIPLLHWRLKLPALDLVWMGAVVALLISALSLGFGAWYLARRLAVRAAVLMR